MDKNQPLSLPSNGEFLPAPLKKFAESVILVPFFGAEKKSLRRHVEFLHELGYDCVLFDLRDNWREMHKNLFSAERHFGLKHTWADQIEQILNEIGGRKIVFSFSNPCASAIEAVARRHSSDIAGLICDSGPSANLRASMVNYFTYEEPIKPYALKVALAAATALSWHPRFQETTHEDLAKFPERFRILSIRGWKDKLITVDMIDQVFEPHSQIDWQKLSLPQAGHLNGLKDFHDEYAPVVAQFLKEISTPV
jgi:pimeloyl-ACP methyl ester carboxylesterase